MVKKIEKEELKRSFQEWYLTLKQIASHLTSSCSPVIIRFHLSSSFLKICPLRSCTITLIIMTHQRRLLSIPYKQLFSHTQDNSLSINKCLWFMSLRFSLFKTNRTHKLFNLQLVAAVGREHQHWLSGLIRMSFIQTRLQLQMSWLTIKKLRLQLLRLILRSNSGSDFKDTISLITDSKKSLLSSKTLIEAAFQLLMQSKSTNEWQ